MVVCVPRDDHAELLSCLEKQVPDSLGICGLLRTSLNGEWPFFKFWVDRWPLVTTVVATPMFEIMDAFSGQLHLVHGPDPEVAFQILQHPGVIEKQRNLTFDIPPHLFPAVTKAFKCHGELTTLTIGTVFVSSRASLKLNGDLDPDLFLDGIQVEDASIIASNWEYKVDGVSEFIRHLVSTNLPKICVRRSSDKKMVAYALTQPHNMIGMVHVDSEFRRQGLGRLLVGHLAKTLLETCPFVSTKAMNENIPSQSLMMSLGFEPTCQYQIVNFEPKMSI